MRGKMCFQSAHRSAEFELVSLLFPHQSLEPMNNGRTAHVVRIPHYTVCLGSESFFG